MTTVIMQSSKFLSLAKAEGLSINQFLVVAAAKKMSAIKTLDSLESESKLSVGKSSLLFK